MSDEGFDLTREFEPVPEMAPAEGLQPADAAGAAQTLEGEPAPPTGEQQPATTEQPASTQEPAEQQPAAEQQPPPVDDAQALRAEVNRLAAELAAARQPQPQKPAQQQVQQQAQQQRAQQEQQEQQQQAPQDDGPIDWVNESEFDEIFANRTKLNEKLTQLFAAAVQHAMQAVPQIAQAQVDWRIYTVSERERFYQANPDLIPYDTYVGQVVNQLAAQDPNKPFHELLGASEPYVRQQLRLPKAPPAPAAPGALPTRTEVRHARPALPQQTTPRQGGGNRQLTVADEIESWRNL